MRAPVRKPQCYLSRPLDRCGVLARFEFSDGTDGAVYLDNLISKRAVLDKLESTFRDGTARGAQHWRDIVETFSEGMMLYRFEHRGVA